MIRSLPYDRRHRNPQISHRREFETPPPYAHHPMRAFVERNRPADDIRLCVEPASPQTMTENYHQAVLPSFFLGGKGPAQNRRHAQNLESVVRNPRAGKFFRLAAPAKRVIYAAAISRDAREDPVLFPPIEEVRIRNSHRSDPALRRGFVE